MGIAPDEDERPESYLMLRAVLARDTRTLEAPVPPIGAGRGSLAGVEGEIGALGNEVLAPFASSEEPGPWKLDGRREKRELYRPRKYSEPEFDVLSLRAMAASGEDSFELPGIRQASSSPGRSLFIHAIFFFPDVYRLSTFIILQRPYDVIDNWTTRCTAFPLFPLFSSSFSLATKAASDES